MPATPRTRKHRQAADLREAPRRQFRGQSISLASYTIRIRPKRDTAFLQLGSFDGQHGFREFFRDFIRRLEEQHAHDELTMSLQRARDVDEDANSVWGFVEAGDYGYGANLIDVGTMRRAYRRRAGDAELFPFYFLMNAPSQTDKGILITQRFGNRGVYTQFSKSLRDAFAEQHGEYLLDIRRHVPAEVVKQLKEGHLKEIQLTSYELSADLADKLRWKGNRSEVSEVVISIKAARKRSLGKPEWLHKMLSNPGNVFEVPDSVGEVADKVRIAVTYNGKQRFVDFNALDALAPYLDVSSEIRSGPDGHPLFQSIHATATKLLDDLGQELGRPS